MNRKRILSLLIAVCVMVCMVVLITSCGSKNKPAGSGDASAEAEVTEEQQTAEDQANDEGKEDGKEEEKDSTEKMYVSSEDGLLLRKGPGQDNDVVYILNYGQEIQVDETKDGWAHTTVDGQTGWCSMEYLTLDEKNIKVEEKSGSDLDPDKLVEPENTSQGGFHGYVDSPEGLNMRYGPAPEYNVIDVIPDKTELTELGWEDGWVYVQYKDKYGWISAQYFRMEGGREKPVIYLYPTRTTDVNVKVKLSDGWFTESIPAGSGEWNVTARPDGKLTDKATGKTYDYIYWESTDNTEYDWSRGFVVKGSEAESFLLKELPVIGLNGKESAEFIDYWLPRLQKNEYNLVTFQTRKYTDAVRMDISPEPDSVLRVFMAFKALDGPVSVAAPDIQPFERTGFTVVEWGGTEVK